MMNTAESVIHLLHVVKSHESKNGFSSETLKRATGKRHKCKEPGIVEKLYQWKAVIEDTRPGAIVLIHLIQGNSIEDIIALKAAELNPELIIIAKNSHHKWFSFKTVSPAKLARKHIAFLQLKPGSLHHKIKSIVLPIELLS